jgi:hypothetical protein
VWRQRWRRWTGQANNDSGVREGDQCLTRPFSLLHP